MHAEVNTRYADKILHRYKIMQIRYYTDTNIFRYDIEWYKIIQTIYYTGIKLFRQDTNTERKGTANGKDKIIFDAESLQGIVYEQQVMDIKK